MNTRKKLITAMRIGGLDDLQMRAALILYSINGLDSAMRFVNHVMIDKETYK